MTKLEAIIAHFPKSERIVLHACHYAQTAHYGQQRKYTGEPYWMHPLRVAHTVALSGGGLDAVLAKRRPSPGA